jgi:hypothetical protein
MNADSLSKNGIHSYECRSIKYNIRKNHSGLKLGLILNFGRPRVEIKRLEGEKISG